MLPSPALATALVPASALACTGCGALSAAGFGTRRDGRPNTRCDRCRSQQARSGALAWCELRDDRGRPLEEPRDVRALRVIERATGLAYADWRSPAARQWEAAQGVTLQELWTKRMVRLLRRSLRAQPPEDPPCAGALELLARDQDRPRRRCAAPRRSSRPAPSLAS